MARRNAFRERIRADGYPAVVDDIYQPKPPSPDVPSPRESSREDNGPADADARGHPAFDVDDPAEPTVLAIDW